MMVTHPPNPGVTMFGSKGKVYAASAVLMLNGWSPGVAEEGHSLIEEVVVTALRREESLQSTPASVTAFTAEAVEAL